jgi:hypothetical protein
LSPRKQEFLLEKSKIQDKLEVFFDAHGFVQYEFIPQRRTVNKEKYMEIFLRLRDAVRRKYPEK